jgi:hypothetical protein
MRHLLWDVLGDGVEGARTFTAGFRFGDLGRALAGASAASSVSCAWRAAICFRISARRWSCCSDLAAAESICTTQNIKQVVTPLTQGKS